MAGGSAIMRTVVAKKNRVVHLAAEDGRPVIGIDSDLNPVIPAFAFLIGLGDPPGHSKFLPHPRRIQEFDVLAGKDRSGVGGQPE